MKTPVLITGASGFLGGHLVKFLSEDFEFISIPHEELSNPSAEHVKGDTLIHFAGISAVPDCEKNQVQAYQVNTSMPLYLAELFFRLNPGGHFIFMSTGQVYDDQDPVPYTEKSKLRPPNTYARSKLAAEKGLKILAESLGGKLTVLRLFNQTHKSQSPNFFLPSIYQQITSTPGKNIHIKVGNINLERDLSPVGDFLTAIRSLLLAPPAHAFDCFNICSGKPKNLQKLARALGERLGKEIIFETDPTRLRGSEQKELYGDSQHFQRAFSWHPQSDSIDHFLNGFLQDL